MIGGGGVGVLEMVVSKVLFGEMIFDRKKFFLEDLDEESFR